MVFLAITPEGLAEALGTAAGRDPVWCGADAITEAEFDALEESNLTRFNYSLLRADQDDIAGAVATVQEHHPGQRVWVEHVQPTIHASGLPLACR